LADLPPSIEHREREKQSERNIDGHDDRAADVAEEHQQDHGHQHHAQNQIFFDGLGGYADQVRAVVICFNLHARQHAAGIRVVELFNFFANRSQGGDSVFALSHEDDAFDFIVLVTDKQFAGCIDDAIDYRCLSRGWERSSRIGQAAFDCR
jgi:hypothetical protein